MLGGKNLEADLKNAVASVRANAGSKAMGSLVQPEIISEGISFKNRDGEMGTPQSNWQ